MDLEAGERGQRSLPRPGKSRPKATLPTALFADKSRKGSPASIASTGLALAVYPVGVERGFITCSEAVQRTLATLRFFWNNAQGTCPRATGYKGFYDRVEKEVKIDRRDVIVMMVGDSVGRISYILYFCFLAFLLLTVAGREIPEISRLADDASNDGQVVGPTEPLPSPEWRRANADGTIETGSGGVHPFALQNFAALDLESRNFGYRFGSQGHPLFVAFAMTGQDLLRFLAIRRT
jgi:hypothetical protein